MATAAQFERTRWVGVVGGVLGLLLVANILSNRVLPTWAYVPWNLTVAAVVVFLATRTFNAGSSQFRDMGFGAWRRGAAWGGVLVLVTAGILLLAVTMPAFNDVYHDRRVGTGTGEWLYQAFVRIPFGTVFLEESVFRAVLPFLFAKRWGIARASILASVCFGLWHVVPALTLNEVNPTATRLFGHGAGGVAVAVVFAVVGTAIVGMWWCWIRYRSNSVLSTMLAHVGSNSVAYTIAWVVGAGR